MPKTSHPRRSPRSAAIAPRYGVARVLSKLGVCSRSQAERAVREGRVTQDGVALRDPQQSVDPAGRDLALDGRPLVAAAPVYIALNKPRGRVVSAADECGRDTVYGLLEGAGLPWLGPVGRLDKASEGLLLLSNDTGWAAGVTDPDGGLQKTYHVQIDTIPDAARLTALREGVHDAGEWLRAVRIELLRAGTRNAWLEVVLDEGRNRQIRRLLQAHGIDVLRLVRVAIGTLGLGELAKGAWRHLTPIEVAALRGLDRR